MLKDGRIFAFDFFCGAGGLTRGLIDAGIKVIAGFDKNENCKKTFESNNQPAKFICSDVADITVADLKNKAVNLSFENILFAGCAPCQPFSQQRKGGENHKDATLLREFGRLVEEALPGQVLIENVPGIANIKGNSVFNRFLRMLSRNGYSYKYGVLNAKFFGVPQNRRRLILIGMRGTTATLPISTHGCGRIPYQTVRNAIAHFPPIEAGERHIDVPNHVAALITKINLQRISNIPVDGGDRRSLPKHLWLKCHSGNYEGHTDVYGRMYWDRPAPTLTGKCNSISNGRYGHPNQNRAISLREAASLQSFSDEYVFYGTNNQVALQIGNSVPPLFAKILGEHILMLRGLRRKKPSGMTFPQIIQAQESKKLDGYLTKDL